MAEKDDCSCQDHLAEFKPGALKEQEAVALLPYLDEWLLIEKNGLLALEKTYKSMGLSAVARWLLALDEFVQKERHHPDIYLNGQHMQVLWQTKACGGVTGMDFKMAEYCDSLNLYALADNNS